MESINILWFRNNLRTLDNEALHRITKADKKILALYCFDPRHYAEGPFGFKKTERYRAKFLLQSVQNLKDRLQKINISLITEHCKPEEAIQKLSQQYNIEGIFTQKEWTDEEIKVNEAIKLDHPGIRWVETYDQFLFHPDDIPFDIEDLPKVFTQFRKICEKRVRVRQDFPQPEPINEAQQIKVESSLPSLNDLGLEDFEEDKRSAFPFKGGEDEALKRMDYYFWDSKKLSFYKKTRNGLLGQDYSSKFSPWLANGSLSPKTIYWDIMEYEEDVEKNDSTYWLVFELIWREFFKYLSLKHENKIFHLGGILNRSYKWSSFPKTINQWINGQTKEPFVNANMLELKYSGWMSNRGRQNVASFLTKNQTIDWRIGAAYFESMLLDYDVHSNYGNWMYVAGVGNDPRDRVFNVSLQASRYDKQGKFQKTWLQQSLFQH